MYLIRLGRAALLGAMIALVPATFPVQAHEFWISPEAGHVSLGDRIVADLKVGRMLSGQSYPYLPDRFRRFEWIQGETERDIKGALGDIPAFRGRADAPGLAIIVQETVAFRVTYDDWSVFRQYLSDEGLDRFARVHRQRGLPETGFSERYIRYAKALVQIGDVREQYSDARTGMLFELVMEKNPYGDGRNEWTVRLFWRGKPASGHRINVFHEGEPVTRIAVTTGPDGRARLPNRGSGEYLLNAVMLEPVENRSDISWQSHWASLAFRLP